MMFVVNIFYILLIFIIICYVSSIGKENEELKKKEKLEKHKAERYEEIIKSKSDLIGIQNEHITQLNVKIEVMKEIEKQRREEGW